MKMPTKTVLMIKFAVLKKFIKCGDSISILHEHCNQKLNLKANQSFIKSEGEASL